MLATLSAGDDPAIITLASKQPFFLVFHDNHKVAVWAAFESLNTGFFEFLALDDSRVRVVKLDGKGFP